MENLKKCTKCGLLKPITEQYFHIRKDSKSGFTSACRVCINKKNMDYKRNNKELVNKRDKEYREKNKEKINESAKARYIREKDYFTNYRIKHKNKINQYRLDNKEKLSAYNKSYLVGYRKENKENLNSFCREYYSNNKLRWVKYRAENYDEISAYNKAYSKIYHKENREQFKIYSERRRTKKLKLVASLTKIQWEKIKIYFKHECAYCGMTESEHLETYGEMLHQDHFVALSKGGEYSINNIIPSCKKCNSKKSNKDFFEWYSEEKFYNAKRKDAILKFLNYKNSNTQQLSILL